jgi:hypothetical protein
VSEPDLDLVREILRDLQRDYREDPFFVELFSTRGSGFIAATGAARAEGLSEVSVEAMLFSWDGLCALLEVDRDADVAELDDLLELSDVYEA